MIREIAWRPMGARRLPLWASACFLTAALMPPQRWMAGAVFLAPPFARAQEDPTSTAAAPDDLPEAVRAVLAGISDFSFSYDGPALIALLSHLKTSGQAPGQAIQPQTVERWANLLEHPTDFRGVSVTVTGVVVRNGAWKFQQRERQHLGTIHELQIRRDDQPIICKLVLTQDVGDVPLGANVTVTGYFLTIQQFYSESNRLNQAAVLVGMGPTLVTNTTQRPAPAFDPSRIFATGGAVTLGLFVAWFLLRRAARRPARSVRKLRAETPAPMNLAGDLAAWAQSDEPISAANVERPPSAAFPDLNAAAEGDRSTFSSQKQCPNE